MEPCIEKQEKKAILVCSFGTTDIVSRRAAIEVIEEEVRASYPDWEVRRAFTSHTVIRVMKERDGISADTPEQAMKKLEEEGFAEVVLMMTGILPGLEYEYAGRVFDHWQRKGVFCKMSMGRPLLFHMGQEGRSDDFLDVLRAIEPELSERRREGEAILLMGHGTDHPTNAFYTVLQERIGRLGWKDTWVYTVAGVPRLEDILGHLKSRRIRKAVLQPLMLVAGEHARNDMAGEGEDSHKSLLEAEGIRVEARLQGLGEVAAVRELYMNRLREAIHRLDEPEDKKKPVGVTG